MLPHSASRVSPDLRCAYRVERQDLVHPPRLEFAQRRGRRVGLVHQVAKRAGVKAEAQRVEVTHPGNLVAAVAFVPLVKGRRAHAAEDEVRLIALGVGTARPVAWVERRRLLAQRHFEPARLVSAPMSGRVRRRAEGCDRSLPPPAAQVWQRQVLAREAAHGLERRDHQRRARRQQRLGQHRPALRQRRREALARHLVYVHEQKQLGARRGQR